jgi:hypothetical protein
MKDDDNLRLDEHQIALLLKKFRAASAKDPSRAKDVIEIINVSLQVKKDEDYQIFEIARTICEILEPERLGGIVSLNCSICKEMLDAQELENKVDTCFACTIKGGEPE